jgi:hypothetical protein
MCCTCGAQTADGLLPGWTSQARDLSSRGDCSWDFSVSRIVCLRELVMLHGKDVGIEIGNPLFPFVRHPQMT